MSFLKEFPSKYEPRPLQKEIINKIEYAIKEKKLNKILVCSPTGTGKSHIAATIAKALKSSITVTAQKILQDQYTDYFEWMYSMKGKSNFPCMALCDSKKIPYKEAKNKKELQCDKGNCYTIKTENGKKKKEYCEYYSTIDQFSIENQMTEKEIVKGPKNKCSYYNQKNKAISATHSIFNYASFFHTKKFSFGFEEKLNKNCLIVDEAHEIEDQMINFIGFDIKKSYIEEVNLKFENFTFDTNDETLTFVEILEEGLFKKIKELETKSNTEEKIAYLKEKLEKIEIIAEQLRENSDNIVVDVKKEKNSENINKISIQPIEISDYVKDYFTYPYQIYFSATLNKEMFCKTMGFSEDECYFIEIPESPFPLKNRTVEFVNVTSLSNRPPESEWEKIYKKIHEIISKKSDFKGLILTSSKEQCGKIFSNIESDSAVRLSILHNDVDKTKEDILEEHEKKEFDVLLSPSLWYGVDLKDDLSRFQIIVKTPYPYLGDKRIREKMKKDSIWYSYTTLVKLLQGFGRSIRNENDFAETFVLDSSAEDLLKRMQKYVPSAYYDILGWNKD